VYRGRPVLVMDLVRGGSLEEQRAQFGTRGWALPILRQIADGVAALHDAGVVHRDLKPANVLLANEVAKISDFGISRLGDMKIDPLAETATEQPVTGTGVILGTPLYMPPEAARGGREVDARGDAFAFGIIAYELLTGRAPFKVPPVMLALAGQTAPMPSMDGLDDTARRLIESCLAGDPGARPSMRAIRDGLLHADR
jgi:serine/threonine protein kinase